MADNTQLNSGAGGNVLATDDCSSVHYQLVKLADGTADSTTVIAVDVGVKANALRVAPASDITDATYIGDIKFGEALPAGTNAIGKLAANSGVDIGDVDILSHPADTFAADAQAYGKGVLVQGDDGTDRRAILVGTDGHVQVDVLSGGGGTAYTEDVATANPIVGTAIMMERDDALATLTPVEGDWAGLRCTSTGALWVGVDGTVTLGANTGVDIGDVDVTSIVPGVAATNLGKAEDAAHTSGDVGVMALTVRQNTAAALSGADADYQPLITDTNGRLHVLDANSATIAGDTTSLDGKVTACNTGAVVVASGAITETNSAALAVVGGGAEATALRVTIANDSTGVVSVDDGAGALTVDWAGTAPPIGAGTEAAALRVTLATDSTGLVSIDDGAGSLTVDSGATFTVQEDGAALTALQLIDNPVAVLGTATYTEATTSGSIAGAVRNDDLATLADTDNEIAPLQVDNEGALYVNAAAAEPKRASGVAAGGAPGTDNIVAAVASRYIRVLALGIFATSATVNNIFLDNADNDLLFNTANPLLLSLDADGDTVPGFILPYNPGGWFQTDTVNEAITLNTSAAIDVAWAITYIEVA